MVVKTCRCCKRGNLRWGQHDGRWLLFEGDKVHDCPVKPLRNRSADRVRAFICLTVAIGMAVILRFYTWW